MQKRKRPRKTPRKAIKKRSKSSKKGRKGNKLKKWAIGLGTALAPSALAIGYGAIKKLLNKNKGYSDIYV